jgi:hypothetical protein
MANLYRTRKMRSHTRKGPGRFHGEGSLIFYGSGDFAGVTQSKRRFPPACGPDSMFAKGRFLRLLSEGRVEEAKSFLSQMKQHRNASPWMDIALSQAGG